MLTRLLELPQHRDFDSRSDSAVPEPPRRGVSLPDLRSRGVRRAGVSAARRSFFVELVDGEIPRCAFDGRRDHGVALVALCSQRAASLGDLAEMHIGVERVEDLELGVSRGLRRIDAQQVDRKPRRPRGPRLGDPPVPDRPGPSQWSGILGAVVCAGRTGIGARWGDGEIARRAEPAASDRKELIAIASLGREEPSKLLGGRRISTVWQLPAAPSRVLAQLAHVAARGSRAPPLYIGTTIAPPGPTAPQ